MQEEFIEWIENFAYKYIKPVFNYYKSFNNNHNGDSILEKIYISFNNIIDYEKNYQKKKKNI